MTAAGSTSKSITIIGGGASRVLLAAHLLRSADADLRVVLIERQGRFGQGLAYSALDRNHRVNVPARGGGIAVRAGSERDTPLDPDANRHRCVSSFDMSGPGGISIAIGCRRISMRG